MVDVSVSAVRGWRPAELHDVAADLGHLVDSFDGQLRSLRAAERSLADAWSGRAASAAEQVVDEEVRTGRGVAAMLDDVRHALVRAADDLSHCRARVLDAVVDAETQGFTVHDDGLVTAPAPPSWMTEPGVVQHSAHPKGVSSVADQERLEDAAATATARLQQLLRTAGEMDEDAARRVCDLAVPAGVRDEALRLTASRIPTVDRLAGVRHLLGEAWDDWNLVTGPKELKDKAGLLRTYGRAMFGERPNLAAAEKALAEFRFGAAPDGIVARSIPGVAVAGGVLEKAFLPITFLSGGYDAITGGGYHGVRGATTRVLGGAGATGAVIVFFALGNPVTLTIASAAVLAYSAWSLGNLAWDHREQILHAAGTLVDAQVAITKLELHAATSTVKAVGHGLDHVGHAAHGALHKLSLGAFG